VLVARVVLVLSVLVALPSAAHVSIASGNAAANKTQEIAFGVGHGCEGADTVAVTIDIPAGVTSVRPMRSDFGPVSVTKDGAGTITNVTWTKRAEDDLDEDIAFYKLVVRMKPPDAPFTKLVFPTHQTCRAADGAETTVDWIAPNEDDPNIEPAPQLVVVPAKLAGWNRFTVPAALSAEDLATFFGDALIVWKSNAAWSANAVTAEQIAATAGVSELTSLAAGDTVMVKY
jgi:uncharacterized protein YcnI